MGQQVSRLQIDVRPALMARFNRLLALGELSTQRELLDTSVTVLEWAVNQRLRGRIIGSIDESTGMFRELHMPYLEACHAKAEPAALVGQSHQSGTVAAAEHAPAAHRDPRERRAERPRARQ
jgi:hypothetical protein